MKSWKEFETQAMNELKITAEYNLYPKKVFHVYIYKGGKVVEIVKDVIVNIAFTAKDKNVAEALQKHDTKIFEAVCVNESELNQAEYFRTELQHRTFNAWYAALREDFGELDARIFYICYTEACDRYDHAGYDEVAIGMHGIVSFAEKIIEVSKQ